MPTNHFDEYDARVKNGIEVHITNYEGTPVFPFGFYGLIERRFSLLQLQPQLILMGNTPPYFACSKPIAWVKSPKHRSCFDAYNSVTPCMYKRRNKRDNTRTGKKKPFLQAFHCLALSKTPPGTMQCTCGLCIIAEPHVCKTMVVPISAPRCRLSQLAFYNKALMYQLLFKAASQTLLIIA